LRPVRHTNTAPDPLEGLQEGATLLGLDLPPATLTQFATYLKELKLWNARINLTALTTDREIVVKHFLDSLAAARFLGAAASLADLGSGGGFPGLVLKLAQPEMAVTLVEAREKKAGFLEYLVARLKLCEVHIVRAQLTPRLARQWGPRFAAVTSRAAFPLVQFLELAAPLLLPGGVALALKGPNLPAAELAAAQERCEPLGLGLLEQHEYLLPLSGEPRQAVLAHRR
jgi:16S rRNA (guanine527-N7)-methyltransferase